MNVGNLKIHQCFITTHPEIFSRYIQYDDENPFDTIQINYAVEDYENMKDTYGKLTSLVVYNTNYFHKNSTKIIQIGFGLSKKVAVVSIVDIPKLKQWKYSISFDGNFLTSLLLQTQFYLIYKPSNNGLPSSTAFDYKEFIHPR